MKFFKNKIESNKNINLFFLRNLNFLNLQKKKKVKCFNTLKFKSDYYRLQKQNNLFNFANVIMKDGKKLKYLYLIFKIFKNFYFFLEKSYFLEKNFDSYYRLSSLFNSYKNLFSINFFFDWLITYLAPKFDLQCLMVPKKYRKKLKCKFIFKLNYVKEFKKNKKVLRWLYLYNLKFNNCSLSERLFNSIVYTFFEDKSSFLYNKKIVIYKKMLGKSKLN